MSDKKKKVIYVKDLVIKADNVTIEPPKPSPRPYDPFLGPVRQETYEEEKYEEEVEEEVDDRPDDDEDKDDDYGNDDRRPFSWI